MVFFPYFVTLIMSRGNEGHEKEKHVTGIHKRIKGSENKCLWVPRYVSSFTGDAQLQNIIEESSIGC